MVSRKVLRILYGRERVFTENFKNKLTTFTTMCNVECKVPEAYVHEFASMLHQEIDEYLEQASNGLYQRSVMPSPKPLPEAPELELDTDIDTDMDTDILNNEARSELLCGREAEITHPEPEPSPPKSEGPRPPKPDEARSDLLRGREAEITHPEPEASPPKSLRAPRPPKPKVNTKFASLSIAGKEPIYVPEYNSYICDMHATVDCGKCFAPTTTDEESKIRQLQLAKQQVDRINESKEVKKKTKRKKK